MQLILLDRLKNNFNITDNRIVSIEVTNFSTIPSSWLFSETQSTQPLNSDPNFTIDLPVTFLLSTTDETKLVYLWTKDALNIVETTPATDEIILLENFIAPNFPTGFLGTNFNNQVLSAFDTNLRLVFVNQDSLYWEDLPVAFANNKNFDDIFVESNTTSAFIEVKNQNDTAILASSPATIIIDNMVDLINPIIYHDSSLVFYRDTILDPVINFIEFLPNDDFLFSVNNFDSFFVRSGISSFLLFDLDTGSIQYTNDALVGVNLTSIWHEPGSWLISESQTLAPLVGDIGFKYSRPTTYEFDSLTEGLKTVYCWFTDKTGALIPEPAIAYLILDTTPPTGDLYVTDILFGGKYSKSRVISLDITANDNLSPSFQYLITESTTVPNINDPNFTPIIPENYTISDVEGFHTVYLWVQDLAGNLNSVIITDYIILDTIAPVIDSANLQDRTSGSIYFSNEKTVTVNVTTIDDINGWIWNHNPISMPSVSDPSWSGSLPITYTFPFSGTVATLYFWAKDLAGNLSNFSTTIFIDQTEPEIFDFYLRDRITGSPIQASHPVVSSFIDNSPDVGYWLISTTQTIEPGELNSEWQTPKPIVYDTSHLPYQLHTFYLWVKDLAGNVGSVPFTYNFIAGSIPFVAEGDFRLHDLTTNSIFYTDSRLVRVEISEEFNNVTEWLLSEEISTQPEFYNDQFQTEKPEFFTLSIEEGFKTVYLWMKDLNNTINNIVISASICYFVPFDIILQPGYTISDKDDNPFTINSTDLKLKNTQGDYILWENYPATRVLNRNLSEVVIYKESGLANIIVPPQSETDAFLLTDEDFSDAITVYISNLTGIDFLRIYHDRDVVYEGGEIRDTEFIESVEFIGNNLTLKVKKFDSYTIENGASNVIIVDFDEYDGMFLNSFVPTMAVYMEPYGMSNIYGEAFIEISATKTIEILHPLNTDTLYYFNGDNESSFELTKDANDIIQNWENKQLIIGEDALLVDFVTSELQTVAIAIVEIPIPKDLPDTLDTTPELEFTSYLNINNWAEFDIDISDSTTFGYINRYGFRVDEESQKIVATYTPSNSYFLDINFEDNSQRELEFGRYYWRVRRNAGPWSETQTINIRSGIPSSIIFTNNTDNTVPFKQDAFVEVYVHDTIHGTSVEFNVVQGLGLFRHSSTTTNSFGLSDNIFTAPNTLQTTLIQASTEGTTTLFATHTITVINTEHPEIRLTFDRLSSDSPIISRYNVYRKKWAPVTTINDDLVMQRIQPLTNTFEPIIVWDQTIYPQSGIIYDPLNLGLSAAIDESNPTEPGQTLLSIGQDQTERSAGLRIVWSTSVPQGEDWHYDIMAMSSGGHLSGEFAQTPPGCFKFDKLVLKMGNGLDASPFMYPNTGEVFSAYEIERLNLETADVTVFNINSSTSTFFIDTFSDLGFDFNGPDPISNLLTKTIDRNVVLKWINPAQNTGTTIDYYRYKITAYTRSGMYAESEVITAPYVIADITDTIGGVKITRINSTLEICQCLQIKSNVNKDYYLLKGSVLNGTLSIKYNNVEYVDGQDFILLESGDENNNTRAKIRIISTGNIPANVELRLEYRYGRDYHESMIPKLYDLVVNEYDGTEFTGYLNCDTTIDYHMVYHDNAYNYALWVKDDDNRLSDPVYTQALVPDEPIGRIAIEGLYRQSTPSTVWNINHNLNSDYINFIIFDNTGQQIFFPDVAKIIDENNLQIQFVFPTSGVIYIMAGLNDASRYKTAFNTGSKKWKVSHNLNTKAFLVLTTDLNNEVINYNYIDIIDENTIEINFVFDQTGNVYIVTSDNIIESYCETSNDLYFNFKDRDFGHEYMLYTFRNDDDKLVIPDQFTYEDTNIDLTIDSVNIKFVFPQGGILYLFKGSIIIDEL